MYLATQQFHPQYPMWSTKPTKSDPFVPSEITKYIKTKTKKVEKKKKGGKLGPERI